MFVQVKVKNFLCFYVVKLGKMTGFGARVVIVLLFSIAAAPLYAFKLNSIDVSGVTLPFAEDIDQKIDALSGQPLIMTETAYVRWRT